MTKGDSIPLLNIRTFFPASNCVLSLPQEAKKTTKKKNTISLPGLPKKWVFIQLQLPNILCKPALTINGELKEITFNLFGTKCFIWFKMDLVCLNSMRYWRHLSLNYTELASCDNFKGRKVICIWSKAVLQPEKVNLHQMRIIQLHLAKFQQIFRSFQYYLFLHGRGLTFKPRYNDTTIT